MRTCIRASSRWNYEITSAELNSGRGVAKLRFAKRIIPKLKCPPAPWKIAPNYDLQNDDLHPHIRGYMGARRSRIISEFAFWINASWLPEPNKRPSFIRLAKIRSSSLILLLFFFFSARSFSVIRTHKMRMVHYTRGSVLRVAYGGTTWSTHKLRTHCTRLGVSNSNSSNSRRYAAAFPPYTHFIFISITLSTSVLPVLSLML